MNQIYYSAYASERASSRRRVSRTRDIPLRRDAVARRRAARIGAIRTVPGGSPTLRRWARWTAGIVCATGSILVATTSMGTIRDAGEPAPTLQRAAPLTTFFFDDEADLLNDRSEHTAGTHPAGALADLLPPAGGDTAAVSIDEAPAVAEAIDPREGASAPEASSQAEIPAADTPLASMNVASPDAAAQASAGTAGRQPVTGVVETVEVRPGDSLSLVLNRLGIGLAEMRPLLVDPLVQQHLAALRVGQQFDVRRAADDTVSEITARLDRDTRLHLTRTATGFDVSAVDLPVERERVVTSGTIASSLFAAAAEADLKQSTIMSLADIFQWELDFARDIRAGDRFAVVYDRLYREGRYIGDGDILAAEFVRGGQVHRAVRFTSPDGRTDYYSPDGKSKRRTFLRHPVDVVRITSHFDPNRMHPVLHQIRAHRGTDYGAPYGSAIRATADGTIVHAGPKSSYGNTVVLQHGSRITTLYAHMSKVAPSARVGGRVRQGDIIGYVGNTGRVTGTHLHYEFRVNDTHVDPLTVELPEAAPLAEVFRDGLALEADLLMAQIRSVLPRDTDGIVVAGRN